ncbi:hypothetical protein THAOC_13197 [Thalassiosira oceanica]|uniref:Uncharacterized protein n=1 Tax=Thalassiosira oceanica TaxID=159749 RepID=K0SI67_THAOC|nr:hypothetical protein THAOC_13197 [Thalassiosira oceanica]|eukprot:EJK65903.1 hypothetical protein THAOC_13197 [Thalassiosira oceanica]
MEFPGEAFTCLTSHPAEQTRKSLERDPPAPYAPPAAARQTASWMEEEGCHHCHEAIRRSDVEPGGLLAEFARQGSALRREHNAPRQSYEQQMEQAVANSLEENTGKPEEDDPEFKQALINSKIDWNVYSAPPTSNGGTVDLVNSDNDGGGKMPSGGIVNLTHSDGSESSLGAPSRSGSSGASAPRRQGTTGGNAFTISCAAGL